MSPLHFLITCFAGLMNRRQQLVIEFLQEEIRVLQEELGKRPRASLTILGKQRHRRRSPCVGIKDLDLLDPRGPLAVVDFAQVGDLSLKPPPVRTLVTNYVSQTGRVVIVGEEPLLEARGSTNGLVQSILYAPIGSTNVVQTIRDLPALGLWTTWQQFGVANLLQSLPALPATNRTLFMRAILL